MKASISDLMKSVNVQSLPIQDEPERFRQLVYDWNRVQGDKINKLFLRFSGKSLQTLLPYHVG